MAEKELNLDAQQSSGGGKKKALMMILGAIVLVAASVGGTLMVVGTQPTAPAEPPRPVAHYLPLETLVINFGAKSPARYLQVEMQVMAFDESTLQAVQRHMPVIRNNVLMLLGAQDYATIITREGKEALRTEVIAAINQVLLEQAQIPADGGIKAVYFTSFVMQ